MLNVSVYRFWHGVLRRPNRSRSPLSHPCVCQDARTGTTLDTHYGITWRTGLTAVREKVEHDGVADDAIRQGDDQADGVVLAFVAGHKIGLGLEVLAGIIERCAAVGDLGVALVEDGGDDLHRAGREAACAARVESGCIARGKAACCTASFRGIYMAELNITSVSYMMSTARTCPGDVCLSVLRPNMYTCVCTCAYARRWQHDATAVSFRGDSPWKSASSTFIKGRENIYSEECRSPYYAETTTYNDYTVPSASATCDVAIMAVA